MKTDKPDATSGARTRRAGRPKKRLPTELQARRKTLEEDVRRRSKVSREVDALRIVDELLGAIAGALLTVEELRRNRSLAVTRLGLEIDPQLAAVRDALRDLARARLEAAAGTYKERPPQLDKAIAELSRPPAEGEEALVIINLAIWVATTLVKRELEGTLASEGGGPGGKKRVTARVLAEEGADDREAALFMIDGRDEKKVENHRRYISNWRREYRLDGDNTTPAGVRAVLREHLDRLVERMKELGLDPDVARARLERLKDEDDPLLDSLLGRWLPKRAPKRRRKGNEPTKG
jgi:hypothetical protein